ncbi:MAG: RNA methyltransferase [Candidatus Margulisbacteria bacterium]|nr:RNA methyltransferase [Candidatus Margulisiibacteriota bacterium]MBU1021113.1 RNA methyltransferase [Candidatus Margulisiibacteriota bacterium]MBU1728668.1 RNA methyltransferase [Candidatus Margulisiibacteriota bacterium]MBU1955119.1 RNA methyltransferase [Candidatus Margulisiibacteriota bacterium]
MLTSLSNPKIKEILRLKGKKQKAQSGKFIIEGIHLLQEAIQSSSLYDIDQVIFSSSFNQPDLLGQLRALEVSDQVFNKMTELENPEGILAVLKSKSFSLEELLKSNPKVTIFGVEIQDPGNLGAIFRTAEALGADSIILSKGTVDPFNSKVVRASMGSILRLPFCIIADAQDAIKTLKAKGFDVVGTHAKRGQNLREIEFSYPLVIVMGSETRGLPEKLVDNITKFVKIPISAKVDSLNVAMAAGIILYEAAKGK